MLLLFAVSVTPKQFLHDIVTGHKHNYTKVYEAGNITTTKAAFQCNWTNEAVESPFDDEPLVQIERPVFYLTSFIKQDIPDFYSAYHLHSSLRGPPVGA